MQCWRKKKTTKRCRLKKKMSAQLMAENGKLPVIKQVNYVFVNVPLPSRSNGIFVPTGCHVRYMQGEKKKETDAHVVITHNPLEKNGIICGEHIDSPPGVWTSFPKKHQLYYPDYVSGQLVQCYCHTENFWGDYIVVEKNPFTIKMQPKNKSIPAQYALSYKVAAITGDNDMQADNTMTRMVAAYDMRGQEWREKQLTHLGLDTAKAHVVPDPKIQPAEKKKPKKKKVLKLLESVVRLKISMMPKMQKLLPLEKEKRKSQMSQAKRNELKQSSRLQEVTPGPLSPQLRVEFHLAPK